LPSDSAQLRADLLSWADERFIIAFVDSNNIAYLAGTIDSPMLMLEDYSNATEKGRLITFSSQGTQPAFILQSYQESLLTSSAPDPLV
jgi:hypothetical protein